MIVGKPRPSIDIKSPMRQKWSYPRDLLLARIWLVIARTDPLTRNSIIFSEISFRCANARAIRCIRARSTF
jgi:hypothetical protein